MKRRTIRNISRMKELYQRLDSHKGSRSTVDEAKRTIDGRKGPSMTEKNHQWPKRTIDGSKGTIDGRKEPSTAQNVPSMRRWFQKNRRWLKTNHRWLKRTIGGSKRTVDGSKSGSGLV